MPEVVEADEDDVVAEWIGAEVGGMCCADDRAQALRLAVRRGAAK